MTSNRKDGGEPWSTFFDGRWSADDSPRETAQALGLEECGHGRSLLGQRKMKILEAVEQTTAPLRVDGSCPWWWCRRSSLTTKSGLGRIDHAAPRAD